MKTRFAAAGAVVGLLCGSGYLLYILGQGPGIPTMVELEVHATVVGVVVGIGAAGGALLGCFRRSKK